MVDAPGMLKEEAFSQGPAVTARVCLGKEKTIMECNEEKNIFGSLYHVREPRTKLSEMAFSAASQHLLQWIERGIFLNV